jgi:hypothetical protein
VLLYSILAVQQLLLTCDSLSCCCSATSLSLLACSSSVRHSSWVSSLSFCRAITLGAVAFRVLASSGMVAGVGAGTCSGLGGGKACSCFKSCAGICNYGCCALPTGDASGAGWCCSCMGVSSCKRRDAVIQPPLGAAMSRVSGQAAVAAGAHLSAPCLALRPAGLAAARCAAAGLAAPAAALPPAALPSLAAAQEASDDHAQRALVSV